MDTSSDEGDAVPAARRVKLRGVDTSSDEGETQPLGSGKRVRFRGVDSSDDEFGAAPARRRSARLQARGRGHGEAVVTELMSEEFGRLQDPLTCRAKIWIDKRHVTHP